MGDQSKPRRILTVVWGDKRIAFPGWAVFLALTLTALVGVTLTSSTPAVAAPAGVQLTKAFPRTLVTPSTAGKTYLTVTKDVTFRSGQLILSSTSDGSGHLGTDDVAKLTVKKKGEKGPGKSVEIDYSQGCTLLAAQPPLDVTSLFTQGANTVTLTLTDRCGVAYESGPYFLVGKVALLPAMRPPQLGKGTNAPKHDDPVNAGTGNFVHQDSDLTFPDHVYGLDWGRTYNDLDDEIGVFGQGWSSTFTPRLIEDDAGLVTLRDVDGRTLEFPPASGAYTRPADFAGDLAKTADGFIIDWYAGDSWTFDGNGRLTTKRNWDGKTAVLNYSGDQLTGVTGPYGYGLTFTYNGDGRPVTVAASDGRSVAYAYNGNGLLEKFTGPAGGVTTYSYNDDGRLTEVKDPDGRSVVKNEYDEAGRVVSQTLQTGAKSTFSYDEAAGSTAVTDQSTGSKVSYAYDGAGQMTGQTDPTGAGITRSYDAAGNAVEGTMRNGAKIKQAFDGRGAVTSLGLGSSAVKFVYDSAGRMTEATDATGGVARFTYTGASRVPSTVTDPTGGVTRYTLEGTRITKTVDPDGVTTGFTYDERGNLTTITDGMGGVTRLAYDPAGNVISATSPLGAVEKRAYDADRRITESTDAVGATTKWKWSPGGALLEETGPLGGRTVLTYNQAGLVETVTDEVGAVTRFDYDDAGNQTAVTGPDSGVFRFAYDDLGRLVGSTDPTGAVTKHGYDVDGNETLTTDALGGETKRAFDEKGWLTSVTDPAGAITRFTYDAAGRPLTITDPLGAVTKTEYDPSGRVAATTDPAGGVTRRRYTAAGRLAALEDPLGNVTPYAYDGSGRQTEEKRPSGGATRYAYDPDDNIASVTTPAGLVTRYSWDRAGQLLTKTLPNGGVIRREYSLRGDRVAETDPSGARRTFEYDATGRMLAAVTATGGKTTYGYDPAGRVTSITDARGNVGRIAYDAVGRAVAYTDALGHVDRLGYDALGRITRIDPAAGDTIDQTWDARGLLLSRSAGSRTTSFTYDAAGHRLTSSASPATTYAYDTAGRLISVTRPDGSVVATAWDTAGRMTGLRYPDGRQVAYSYNADNQLVALDTAGGPLAAGILPKTIAARLAPQADGSPADLLAVWRPESLAGDTQLIAGPEVPPAPFRATFDLDPDGRLLAEHLPSGWSRGYTYDAGLLSSYTDTSPGEAEARTTTLARDANGRVVAETTAGQATRYTYDANGQLAGVSGGPEGQVTYTYDATGNRLTRTGGGATTRYTYDAAQQLTEAAAGKAVTRYRWDDSGRLVREEAPGSSTDVGYDPFGRTASRKTVAGRVTTTRDFAYDADNRLVGVHLSTSQGKAKPVTRETSFRWTTDALPRLLTENDNGTEADFVYGYSRLAALGPAQTAIFNEDADGSALSTLPTKPWVTSAGYDTFGRAAPAAGPSDLSFAYRGELSLGGDLYLQNRFYDPDTGRFTTRDPLPGALGEPTVANPYPYAGNDPVNRTDPLGLRPTDGAFSCLPGYTYIPPSGSGRAACQAPNPPAPAMGPFVPTGPAVFGQVPVDSDPAEALACAEGELARPEKKEKPCKKGKGPFGRIKNAGCRAHKFAKDHKDAIEDVIKVAEIGVAVGCIGVTGGLCAAAAPALAAVSLGSKVAIEGKISASLVIETAVDKAAGKFIPDIGVGDKISKEFSEQVGKKIASKAVKSFDDRVGQATGKLIRYGYDELEGQVKGQFKDPVKDRLVKAENRFRPQDKLEDD